MLSRMNKPGFIALLVLLAFLAIYMPYSMVKAGRVQGREELKYFKDAHGLCYARLESISYWPWYVSSIATVPCDKVGL